MAVLSMLLVLGGSTTSIVGESNGADRVVSQTGIAFHAVTGDIAGWVVKQVSKVWIQKVESANRDLENLA